MDHATARLHMIDSQVRPNRVTDAAVIEAMASIPRDRFLPKPVRGIAYIDEALEIAPGRHMMEPMVIARLLQEAAVTASDLALVVGVGAGYCAALLSAMAGGVVAVENDPEIAAKAAAVLTDLGFETVSVVEGDLGRGYPGQAPYDVIFINGAVEVLPAAIAEQLAEGGRLVAIRLENGIGHGVLMTRSGGHLGTRKMFDAGTPLLPGFARESGFEF